MSRIARLIWVVLCASLTGGQTLMAGGARLFKSGPIQVSADGAWVWAVNPDNDSVSRLEAASDAVLEVVLPDPATRDAPRGLSLREDGSEVWVACHDSDRVYVLAGTGAVLDRIDLPWGSGPHSIALSRDQKTAVVTLHRAASIAVLDVPSRAVAKILGPVHWSPMGIAWEESGAGAWVTHLFAAGEHPFLTRVDVSGPEPRVSTSIQVFATDPRSSGNLAAPYNIAEGGYLTTRGHPAQVPSASGRNELWLPVQYNNIHDDVFGPDSTVQSTLRRLDLATRKIPNSNADKVILTAVHVHNPSGNAYVGPGWNAKVSGPADIAFSADGRRAYVLHELSNDLVVIDTNAPAVRPAGAPPLPEIPVGDRPIGLAASPVGDVAYVYNLLSRDVSVVDLASATELRRIPATPSTGEVRSGAFLRGARLFHTSADPRISANQKVSCASCHINAEIDGRTWGFHTLPGPHGPRSVPSLLGLGLTLGARDPATGFGQLHISGDRDEIQDFEHTFRGPNMGGTGFLGAQAQPEMGPPNAGRDADLDAIALYLASIEPLARSPHRQADGALGEAAVRGATFFTGSNRAAKRGDAGCASCHVPETGFVDFAFHDVGQSRPGSEEELNSRTPAWHVNTPTLIGVWMTSPYSGVSTFESSTVLGVIQDAAKRAASATPHGKPDGLTRRQMADLAAFVLSVDGNMTAAEARAARDTAPPRIERVAVGSLASVDVWFSETVKPGAAADPASWLLEEVGGGEVAIVSARFDTQNGDRVTLGASLRANHQYRLTPRGTILDDADAATGGVANAIDLSDPQNQQVFAIGDRLTITLGASGYEDLTVSVHDASTLGPSLSTWSHDSVWLFPAGGGPGVNTGFVRFEWRDRFLEATGVSAADQILAASFSLQGEFGDAQTVEIRRALQSWTDPSTGGDWNTNPAGGPTWRDHSHPNGRWNAAGAGALGGTGESAADYNGAFDLAAAADASVRLEAVNERVTFGGTKVTEAFRFWFDNPAVDNGYGLRLARGSNQEAKFERWESVLQQDGPVLSITYSLTGVSPVVRQTLIAAGDDWRYAKGTQAPPADWADIELNDASWAVGPTGIGYGDGDDATVLADMQCTGGGEGEACTGGGYLAFFARKSFDIANPASVEGLTLTVSYDDGFAAYLNGVEVSRINLPAGDITHQTAASATVGDAPVEPDAVIEIPPGLLVQGKNVLAASVHNAVITSSDVSFIPGLVALSRETTPGDGSFLRGDANADGDQDISDGVFILLYLFAGGEALQCPKSADVDDSGSVNITDPVFLFEHLFRGGRTPPAPYPGCGQDTTADSLTCPGHAACGG